MTETLFETTDLHEGILGESSKPDLELVLSLNRFKSRLHM